MIKVDVSKGIQVGGYLYSFDTSELAHRQLKTNGDYGRCDNRNKVIYVDTRESEVETSETIIHEMLEAIKEIYFEGKDQNLSHGQLSRLACGIHQIMEGLGVRFVP